MLLKDKVCIITGGAVQIGRAFAEQLLKEGAFISIFDLDSDSGELCCAELQQQFGKKRVIFCHCDVTDYTQFEESFFTTKDTFGRIDVLVNNAEIQNDKFWELETDVNLNGFIRGTLLAYQFMSKDKGNGGTIVNIGSSCSVKPFVSSPIYTATKHAIIGLTKAYGDQYHFNQTGVRVICYCVGPTESDSISHSRQNNNTPNHERARKIDMQGMRYQKLDHVAKELIPIILNASSGSLWVVKNDEKSKEIPYSSEIF
ncbi:15-hydroxyprostaglandin dehydrogenase [NAD(+)]-like [Chironomus tepperi]|uniref:15-hydroxyprostaglandin dehydrogenase [NAD(+)]-like n=1 Tax=Chironomus tepperi TaxID=113505 RepID=UPI00391EE6BB